MESEDLAGPLHELERAEAAPYVQLLASPWWYPPVVGVWAAALCATIMLDLGGPVLLGLVAIELAGIGWLVRRQGVWPKMSGRMPTEISRTYRHFAIGLGVLALLVALAAWLGGVWVTTGVVLLGVSLGLWLYERDYAIAAARVRKRLG